LKTFYLKSFRAPKRGLKNCSAECFNLALGKEAFAEYFFYTRQRNFFAECFLFDTQSLLCREQRLLQSVFYKALDKVFFAECPKKHSLKPPALGKEAYSDSDR
jgi:hypothetical protein